MTGGRQLLFADHTVSAAMAPLHCATGAHADQTGILLDLIPGTIERLMQVLHITACRSKQFLPLLGLRIAA